MKLPIRSRYGNLLLLTLGAVVAIASATLLVVAVVMLRGTGGIINLALQVYLLCSTAAGTGIAWLARANLRSPRKERTVRDPARVSEAM